ncbi:MAG TPA: bifunctional DNA-formamidopyrimidine glycosylase/DNA-(apurinic or apyrimidinic site) lyase [Pirellulales bacterium]|nr:bifunctional DNA-formamidopyrimidine glycosylase/DNA-(apurinic or apyrimidinic site) lyase [Pirellulales bacterium]
MPELPEVETMRRGILSVVGRRIAEVRLPRCRKRPILIAPSPATLRRRAVGQKIVAVDRAGKRVVLRLASGDAIVFEPRMAGLVLLGTPPTREHLRLRIVLDDGREVLFWDRRGLGLVRLVRQDEFEKHYGAAKLGPDALALSWQELAARLAKSRRPIKVALLDQAALAGVGNLYASELLHLARIDPRRPCNELSKAEWRRVHAAMLEVLHAAIRHEGSTLGDGTYRNALNEEGSYQNHHRVYDRAGQRCERCRRGEIERIVQAQRSTYFCARCQK